MDEEDTIVQTAPQTRSDRSKGRPYVTVLSGEASGAVFRIAPGESVIGRGAETDIQLVDSGVSRRHAKIVRDPDGTAKIMDLKSTNGTYVNGRRIDIEVLREGDRLRIGKSTTLDFGYEEEREAEADGESDGSGLGGVFDKVASALDNIGRLHQQSRNYDDALQAYGRTLSLREEKFGKKHPAVAAILDSIGGVLSAKEDYKGALEHHRRALDIYESRTRDRPPPEMVHTLTSIGECHLGLQQAEDAIDPLERSLDLLEDSEATNTELARVRFALARALATAQDNVNRARTLARQARDGFADGDKAARTMVSEVDDFLSRKPS